MAVMTFGVKCTYVNVACLCMLVSCVLSSSVLYGDFLRTAVSDCIVGCLVEACNCVFEV